MKNKTVIKERNNRIKEKGEKMTKRRKRQVRNDIKKDERWGERRASQSK